MTVHSYRQELMGAQTDNHGCTIWLLADGLVLNRHFLPNFGGWGGVGKSGERP